MPKPKHWKLIIICAAFAVVLSALISSLSGVPAGIVIVRTLFWGSLFALLGFTAVTMIEKYLPGLMPVENDEEAAVKDEIGATIDITLDGDSSPLGPGSADYGFESSDTDADMGSYDADSGDSDEFGTLEIVDPDDSENPGYKSGSQAFATEEGSELPNMSGLDASLDRQYGSLSTPGSRKKADLMGMEDDPDSIVKAVRTLLKRDQEG